MTQEVKLLLQCGADPNIKDKNGDTPLHKIIRKNIESIKQYCRGYLTEWEFKTRVNFDIIRLLIIYGADPKYLKTHREKLS